MSVGGWESEVCAGLLVGCRASLSAAEGALEEEGFSSFSAALLLVGSCKSRINCKRHICYINIIMLNKLCLQLNYA